MKTNYLEKGKIPPQATDLEEAVLGALLIDKRSIVEIEFLEAEMFYKEPHKLIYGAILEIYRTSGDVDILTVANLLRDQGNLETVGGDFYIMQLSQVVASSAHIERHSRIILEKHIKRCLIVSGSKIIESSYDETTDVFDVLDKAHGELNNVSESAIKKQESTFSSIIDGVLERGKKIFNKEIKPGISTPIKKLTDATGGWRNSELIILAARPGMGKTAFAVSKGLFAAREGYPTAFFSLEMSKEQLASRIISMECRIDNQKFNVHGLSEEDLRQIEYKRSELTKLPFYIDDTANLTIEQFQVKAKRLKSKHNIKFIIVDYLQLMTSSGKGGNREQEISKISRGLKLVAKELNIPVVALSQLSRGVETRGGSKRPLLSDLRESGAIEQDADVVEFLYRPEYYGITEWDDDEHSNCIGEAECIVAKNRNGALIKARMKFEGKYTLFSDIDSHYTHPDDFDVNEFKQDPNDGDSPF
jgi:replicative DNA helicase